MRIRSPHLRKSILKSAFIFLTAIILALGIVVGWGFYHSKIAVAAWFDESWLYRKAITVTVTSSSSDITNLETLVTVDTSTSGRFQSACQDLRFTNTGGKPLPYYIDSGCGTASTKVWVLVDLVPKNTTTYNMYMYYGNPSASAASDSTKFRLFNGLVGYWTMNESSWAGTANEVKDSSVNGNHGQAAGNATTTSSGKYSYAGTFDGTGDYVNAGNSSVFNVQSTFSLSAWVNPASSNFSQYPVIINKPVSDSTNNDPWSYYILQFNPSGNFHGYISDGTAGHNSTVDSLVVAQVGQWYHVVFTFDNGAMKMYVNGALSGQATASYTVGAGSTSLLIASTPLGAVSSFNGQLDDVRIYNRALTLSEVEGLYSNPGNIASYGTAISQPTTSAGSEEAGPGPVGYWKFDDPTFTPTGGTAGQAAKDSSSSRNDGVLGSTVNVDANDPTWTTEDQCVSGKCLYFDGSTSYVDFGNAISNWYPQSTYSLSAWVRPASTSRGSIFGNLKNGGDGYEIYISSTGLGYTGYNGGKSASASYSFSVNTWYHIDVVSTGSIFTFYVNGVALTTSYSNWGTISSFTNDLSTRSGYTWVFPFKGFIDEVKIYPYARTKAQILADYNARGASKGLSADIGPQNQWLSQGLVGYWKMDETSWSGAAGEVLDASGNSNNGQSYNSGTTSSGKFGNAANYDGTHTYYQIVPQTTQNLSTATVALWIYENSLPSSGNEDYPISNYSGCPGVDCGWLLAIGSNGEFNVRGNGTYSVSSSGAGISAGLWKHLVFTLNSAGNIQLYSNGVLVATTANTYQFHNQNYVLGTASWAIGGRNMNGKIDEVRIYNRALSPKEVSDLYNFAPGLVVHLKMDESKGTSANDTSGQGRTGTLNGNPVWTVGKYGAGVKLDGTGDNVSVSDFAY